MTERIPKKVIHLAIAGLATALAYFAYTRPWYFTSQSYLSGLIFLEFVVAAVWMYRRYFFAVVLVTFLLAGVNLPVGRGWAAGRWVVLGVGALVGLIIILKDHFHRFGFFHLLAFFAVLTGVISAAVSNYPDVALLKVLSMLLLFVYGATGVRVATIGRENNFFRGLLLGCEILVGCNVVFYTLGIQAMGNPNSLGAIIGIVASPILLWGVLLGGDRRLYNRRLLFYVLSLYLVFLSHARAGIAAALFSSAVLCFALKKYKLLVEGMVALAIVVAAVALIQPNAISSMTTSVVYKNKEEGILASRQSPWQAAIDNFNQHPWFGMGLGTTIEGKDANEERSQFSSSGAVTAENGSSYLSLLVGVGTFGAIPFGILLVLLLGKILRTIMQMRASGNAVHPAVPLAMVAAGGLLHAAFEDWMFAPGNYLCVFFWCVVFLLHDFAPSSPRTIPSWHWQSRAAQGAVGGTVPSS